ncbi:MAG: electron transfer flavoprotein subunit beta/FixA family protein [Actinomycetales bacterium]
MTDVLVCVKRVVDPTGKVTLSPDEQSIDGRYAGFTLSRHEECAIELAVQVAKATDGSSTVVTLGDEDAEEQLRTALAMGVDAATHIVADSGLRGPADVAAELAAVVTDHAASGRVYGLVLLGNDAADSGDFQVGIRLAHELGRPIVNGANVAEIKDDHVVAFVKGPDGQETYDVPLPAVVTVLEGGVEPRYPTIPGRMKAKRVTIEQRQPGTELIGPSRVRLRLPEPPPSQVQVLGTGAAAAGAVVDLLETLGVLTR